MTEFDVYVHIHTVLTHAVLNLIQRMEKAISKNMRFLVKVINQSMYKRYENS